MSETSGAAPPAPPGLSDLGEIVRRGDPDRFEAALFAEPDARERLFALYAFNLELARAPWRSQEPHIALMRLQWWRDTVEEAFTGAPPRAHEIAEPFARLIAETAPDRADLERLVDAREREIEPDAFADRASLDAYLDETAGALMRLATTVCLARRLEPDESAAAGALGSALGAARLLEATPELAARGRALLPLGAGDRSAVIGGETTDGARRVIAELAADASGWIAKARAARALRDRKARPALLSAWRAERILRAAAQPDLDVFADFSPESPFRRRASLLWRAGTGRW